MQVSELESCSTYATNLVKNIRINMSDYKTLSQTPNRRPKRAYSKATQIIIKGVHPYDATRISKIQGKHAELTQDWP